MSKVKILWADDEIDLLKPHILFLKEKGYDVETINNGEEALDMIEETHYDIVFLDENMPGLTGLETLAKIKEVESNLPVVLITKSEEEHIMEEAIGGQIADYLIKPVNPNQILLSIKKNLDNSRLVTEHTNSAYQREFRNIGMTINSHLDFEEWIEVYKKLVYWEIELDKSDDKSMEEILKMQKSDANNGFSRFIEDNYLEWLNGVEDAPVMSHTLMKKMVIPELSENRPLFVLVLDCLRYDQWKILRPVFEEKFRVDLEDIYCSILPTATQYARNAIFAGLLPSEIEKLYKDLWKNDEDEGGKNLYEEELFGNLLKRLNRKERYSYNKVTNLNGAKKLNDRMNNLFDNQINVIVYNFVDTLTHARTDTQVVRELAEDEAAYRSITRSWFEHSPLKEMIDKMAAKGADLIVTTDHGAVYVDSPVKVLGDRNLTTNLRYKQGKNMRYEAKEVFEIERPDEAFLPKQNVSSRYIFSKGNDFFAYPNNYNHYVKYYRGTFQHGGVSMEEMLVPVVKMSAK